VPGARRNRRAFPQKSESTLLHQITAATAAVIYFLLGLRTADFLFESPRAHCAVPAFQRPRLLFEDGGRDEMAFYFAKMEKNHQMKGRKTVNFMVFGRKTGNVANCIVKRRTFM